MTENGIDHLTEESKELWRIFTEEYGIDDSGGREILKTGLEARDRASGARKAIDAEGMTILDRFGCRKPHPLLAAERDSRAQYLAALRALNLDLEPVKPVGRPPGT